MKCFPYDFASRREALFYPAKPDVFAADVLEIGPGRGDILLSEAEILPHKRFVGIEIKKRRYFRLIKRVEKRQLTNVLLIQGDARIVIPTHFGVNMFERIYVLFPDPWPKRRHTSMRLLGGKFLETLSERLRDDGLLIVATDDQDHCRWIMNNAARVPALEPAALADNAWLLSSRRIPTFYELKWRAEGRGITYLAYRKRPNADGEIKGEFHA